VYSLARLEAGDGTPLQTLSGVRNAHAVVVSDDSRFVYATSLGNDELLCCAIDENQAQPLTVVDTVSFDTGFGPRHMRLSPGGEWLYVLSEFRAAVAVFRRDTANGTLALHGVSPRASVLAGLNDGFARPPSTEPQPDPATLTSLIWAADIHVRPDGLFIYISERTTNRLLVLRVRPDGMLRTCEPRRNRSATARLLHRSVRPLSRRLRREVDPRLAVQHRHGFGRTGAVLT
jgi:6-phosphogluconolactonase